MLSSTQNIDNNSLCTSHKETLIYLVATEDRKVQFACKKCSIRPNSVLHNLDGLKKRLNYTFNDYVQYNPKNLKSMIFERIQKELNKIFEGLYPNINNEGLSQINNFMANYESTKNSCNTLAKYFKTQQIFDNILKDLKEKSKIFYKNSSSIQSNLQEVVVKLQQVTNKNNKNQFLNNSALFKQKIWKSKLVFSYLDDISQEYNKHFQQFRRLNQKLKNQNSELKIILQNSKNNFQFNAKIDQLVHLKNKLEQIIKDKDIQISQILARETQLINEKNNLKKEAPSPQKINQYQREIQSLSKANQEELKNLKQKIAIYIQKQKKYEQEKRNLEKSIKEQRHKLQLLQIQLNNSHTPDGSNIYIIENSARQIEDLKMKINDLNQVIQNQNINLRQSRKTQENIISNHQTELFNLNKKLQHEINSQKLKRSELQQQILNHQKYIQSFSVKQQQFNKITQEQIIQKQKVIVAYNQLLMNFKKLQQYAQNQQRTLIQKQNKIKMLQNNQNDRINQQRTLILQQQNKIKMLQNDRISFQIKLNQLNAQIFPKQKIQEFKTIIIGLQNRLQSCKDKEIQMTNKINQLKKQNFSIKNDKNVIQSRQQNLKLELENYKNKLNKIIQEQNYIQMFQTSEILESLQQKKIIQGFFYDLYKKSIKSTKLCFKMDMYNYDKFHNYCDEKNNLLVIAVSSNYKFGAYTQKPFVKDQSQIKFQGTYNSTTRQWTNTGFTSQQFTANTSINSIENSFLFSLNRKAALKIKSYKKATRYDSTYGPIFGEGEFKIDLKNKGFSNVGISSGAYDAPYNVYQTNSQFKQFLAGGQQFPIKSYEVYQIELV